MATESVDGEVGPGAGRRMPGRRAQPHLLSPGLAALASSVPLPPSSAGDHETVQRVALMVLCETHRARMVKHHCCRLWLLLYGGE